MADKPVDDGWRIPDELWSRIEPLLPHKEPSPKGGRPRMPDRQAMDAISSVLRTGCQWKALPQSLGAASTVHDRFQEWRKAGVCKRLWQAGLLEDDTRVGIAWAWQAMDGAITKAPLGQEGTGPHPTDRRTMGTKRSLLTEGKGMPLAIVVEGANRHDMKLTEATLQAIVIERPQPTAEKSQHLCLDKGYDYPQVRELVEAWGYTAHIRTRGEEAEAKERIHGYGYRARRWVVERTHSWLNRFRRLLIRWEKKVENYLAMLHFACAWITFRAAGVFG